MEKWVEGWKTLKSDGFWLNKKPDAKVSDKLFEKQFFVN